MERLRPGQIDLSFSTLERAANFISAPDTAQRIDLVSGLFLFREADSLYLTDDVENLPLDAFPQMGKDEIPLTVPCEINLNVRPVRFHTDSWILTAKSLSSAPMLDNGNPFEVTLDADALGGELSLRTRRAGDKFQPLGMDGKSTKLKEFFINVKLPRRAREHYPLLCVDDEIVWISGYRPAHRVRVTESTQRVVHLVLTRLV